MVFSIIKKFADDEAPDTQPSTTRPVEETETSAIAFVGASLEFAPLAVLEDFSCSHDRSPDNRWRLLSHHARFLAAARKCLASGKVEQSRELVEHAKIVAQRLPEGDRW